MERYTKFAARKAITLAGVPYGPGDPVDVSALAQHKVDQLLRQRIIRPVNEAGNAPVGGQ